MTVFESLILMVTFGSLVAAIVSEKKSK
ncbi:putative holin-like toxin [Virgibacillus xinjiangensis]|uniref:Holin-like toxin n=1 Tax=Virgibacillus xinjiangensis TaxID=393090 RepID=A0ABV7CVX0_9BACI